MTTDGKTSRSRTAPGRRWWQRWEQSYHQHGGWTGRATMQHQWRNATRYYRAGATAEAAGLFCAEQNALHSALTSEREYRELVQHTQ